MKRFIALLLSLCLLMSIVPGYAENGNNGNNGSLWDHELFEDERSRDLYQRIWEAFVISGEEELPVDFDQDSVRALIEKLIGGEELTEEDIALQGAISPVGLALLVSYTLTPPQPEQVADIYTALDEYVAKTESRQLADIPEEEIEEVYATLDNLCVASGVQMVLTPVAEGAKTSYVTLINPEIANTEHEVSALLFSEVPAKQKANVAEIVAVVLEEQGEEAVEQLQQIAQSDMTDEEAEEQIKTIIAPSVVVPVVTPAPTAEPTEEPEQPETPVVPEEDDEDEAPVPPAAPARYSYRVEQYYFNAVDGTITGGYVRKIVGATQTTTQAQLTIEAPASAEEGYVFAAGNENNILSRTFTDTNHEYIYRVLYVKDTPSATPAPTVEPTPVPTAEPTVEPTPVPTAEPTVEPEEESRWTVDMYYEEELYGGASVGSVLYGYIIDVRYDDEILTFDEFDVEVKAEGLDFEYTACENGTYEVRIEELPTVAAQIPVTITISSPAAEEPFVIETTLNIVPVENLDIPQVSFDYDSFVMDEYSELTIDLPALTQEQMDAGWFVDFDVNDVDSEVEFEQDGFDSFTILAAGQDTLEVTLYLRNRNYNESLCTFPVHVVHPDQDPDTFDPNFRVDVGHDRYLIYENPPQGYIWLGDVFAWYGDTEENLKTNTYSITVSDNNDDLSVSVHDNQDMYVLTVSGDMKPCTMDVIVTAALADGSATRIYSFTVEMVDSATLTVPEMTIDLPDEDIVLTIGETMEIALGTISQAAMDEGWTSNIDVENWEFAGISEWFDESVLIEGWGRGVTYIQYYLTFSGYNAYATTRRLIVCPEGEDPADVLADWENGNIGGGDEPIHVNIEQAVVLSEDHAYANLGSVDPVCVGDEVVPPSEIQVEFGDLNTSAVSVYAEPQDEFFELRMERGPGYTDGEIYEIEVSVTVTVDGIEPYTETRDVTVYTIGALTAPVVDTLPTEDIVLYVMEEYVVEEIGLDTSNAVPANDNWTVYGFVRNLPVDEYDHDGVRKIIPMEPGEGEFVYELKYGGAVVAELGTRNFYVLEEGEDKENFDPNWNIEMGTIERVVIGSESGIGEAHIGQLHEVIYAGTQYAAADCTITASFTDQPNATITVESGEHPSFFVDGTLTGSTATAKVTIALKDDPTKTYTKNWTVQILGVSDLSAPIYTGSVPTGEVVIENMEEPFELPKLELSEESEQEGWAPFDVVIDNNDIAHIDWVDDVPVIIGREHGITTAQYYARYANYRMPVGDPFTVKVGTGISEGGGNGGEQQGPWRVNVGIMDHLVIGSDIPANMMYAGQLHEVYYNDTLLDYGNGEYTYSFSTDQSGVTIDPDSSDRPTMYLNGTPTGTSMNVTVTVTLANSSEEPYSATYPITLHTQAEIEAQLPNVTAPTGDVTLAVGETKDFPYMTLSQAEKDFGWQARVDCGGHGIAREDEENQTITGNSDGIAYAQHYVQWWNYRKNIGDPQKVTVGTGISQGGGNGGEQQGPWRVNVGIMDHLVIGSDIPASMMYAGQLHEVFYNDTQLDYGNGDYTYSFSTDQSGVTIDPDNSDRPTMYLNGTPTGTSMNVTVTVTLANSSEEAYSATYPITLHTQAEIEAQLPNVTAPTGDVTLAVGETKDFPYMTLSQAEKDFGWQARVDCGGHGIAREDEENQTITGNSDGIAYAQHYVQWWNYRKSIGDPQKVTVGTGNYTGNKEAQIDIDDLVVFGADNSSSHRGNVHVMEDGQPLQSNEFNVVATSSNSDVAVYVENMPGDPGYVLRLENVNNAISGTTSTTTDITVTVTLTDGTTFTDTQTVAVYASGALTPPTVTTTIDTTPVVLEKGETYTVPQISLDMTGAYPADGWHIQCSTANLNAQNSYRDGHLDSITAQGAGIGKLVYELTCGNACVRILGEQPVHILRDDQDKATYDPSWAVDYHVIPDLVPGLPGITDLHFGQIVSVYYNSTQLNQGEFTLTGTTDQPGVTVSSWYEGNDGPLYFFSGNAPTGSEINATMTVALTSDPTKTYTFSAKVNLHEVSTLTPPQLNGSLSDITVTNVGDTANFTPASFSDPDWKFYFDIEDESIAEYQSSSNPGEYTIYGKEDGTTYVRYYAQYVNYDVEIGRQKVIVGNGVGNPWKVDMAFMEGTIMDTNIDPYAGQLHDVYYNGQKITRSDYNLNVTIDNGLSIKPDDDTEPTLWISGTPTGSSATVTVTISLKSDPSAVPYTTSKTIGIKYVNELTTPDLTVSSDDITVQVGGTTQFSVPVLNANDNEWYVRFDVDGREFADTNEREGVLTVNGNKRGGATLKYSVQYWNHIVYKGQRQIIVHNAGEDPSMVDTNWKADVHFMYKVVVGPDITADNLYAGQVHNVSYNGTQIYPGTYTVTGSTNQSGVGINPSSGNEPTLFFSSAPSVGMLKVTASFTAPTLSGATHSVSETIEVIHQDSLTIPKPTIDTTAITLEVGKSISFNMPTITPEERDEGWQMGKRITNEGTYYDVTEEDGVVTITAKEVGSGTFTYMADFWNYHVAIGTRTITVTAPGQQTLSLTRPSASEPTEPELGGVDETNGGSEQLELGTVTPSEAE